MGVKGKYIKATLGLLLKIHKGKVSMVLAKKARAIGVDRYNGPGGKLEPGETLRDCQARETLKELGVVIDPRALEHVAVIDFYNRQDDNSIVRFRVWVYIAYGWKGKLKASEDEMVEPALFPLDALPFDQMMEADRLWIPEVLFKGRKVWGVFHYSPQQKSIESEPIMNDLPEEMEDN